MHAVCKSCGQKIAVAGRPKGSTRLKGVQTHGNVRVEGGGIFFGPGGGISFGPGGGIGFGPPVPSKLVCLECGATHEYAAEDIQED